VGCGWWSEPIPDTRSPPGVGFYSNKELAGGNGPTVFLRARGDMAGLKKICEAEESRWPGGG